MQCFNNNKKKDYWNNFKKKTIMIFNNKTSPKHCSNVHFEIQVPHEVFLC